MQHVKILTLYSITFAISYELYIIISIYPDAFSIYLSSTSSSNHNEWTFHTRRFIVSICAMWGYNSLVINKKHTFISFSIIYFLQNRLSDRLIRNFIRDSYAPVCNVLHIKRESFKCLFAYMNCTSHCLFPM